MKKSLFICLSLILISSSMASSINFENIAGKYKITHDDFAILNIVTIGTNGDISLIENTYQGQIYCSGQASLEKFKLTSNVKCENGQEFNQIINLENVTNFLSFSAPVYSSLYDLEIIMNFTKIE